MANTYDAWQQVHKNIEVSVTNLDGGVKTSDGYDWTGDVVMRVPFIAGAATPGDGYDIYIANANLPAQMRILDCTVFVTTGAGTATLRDTAAGGGTALTDAMSTASAGVARSNVTTGTKVVPANGTIVLRRSSQNMAGEVIVQGQYEK